MSRPIVLAVLAGTLLGLTASAAGSQAAASGREGTITFIRGGRLFAIRPDGSGLRPLTPPSTSVWFYAWSPDATRIAYIDQGASLWLMRPDGSGRRLLLPTATLSSGSLSWSPDGTRLAIVSPGPDTIPFGPDANARCCSKLELYVVPVAGGPPALLPAGKHVGWGLAWSPQGDEIYYGAGAILAIHPDGTARRWISTVGYVGSLSADGRQFVFNVPCEETASTGRSASSTPTERASASLPATPTPSTGRCGRRRATASSTAELIARASTWSAPTGGAIGE